MTALADSAQELAATVKKHETDASQNAYDAYHALFAAHEGEIQAKDAGAQGELEEAMHGIRDALAAGDWSKSETAAQATTTTSEGDSLSTPLPLPTTPPDAGASR